MKDFFRYVASRLFGTVWVVIIDHNRERYVSRVIWIAGRAAARHMTIHVALLDHGKVAGPSWVKSWEPYDPCHSKELPEPPSGCSWGSPAPDAMEG